MDVTVQGHGDLADKLAGLSTASVVTIEGSLHIAKWKTGDGTDHKQIGVYAEKIDVT